MKNTDRLIMETAGNKLWCLTKHRNDEENKHGKITLLQDRKMIKEASNIAVELQQ